MAQQPDWANTKVGGSEYMREVEEARVKLLQEREERRRTMLAARTTALAAQRESSGIAPLRNHRIDSVAAARDPTSLFLTPEPEAQATAQRGSRDHDMVDAPSSPDEPLAARRKMSELGRRANPGEGDTIKKEKSSESASSSRPPSGAAVAPMGPIVTERSSTAYAAAQFGDDRRLPPRQGNKVPKSMMPKSTTSISLKRPNEANASSGSYKRRSPSDEPSPPEDQTAGTTNLSTPDWYRIQRPAPREASTQSLVTFMSNVKDYIQRLDVASRQGNTLDIETVLDKIRNWIHTMEYQTVQADLLKATKLLDTQNLPKLFHNLPEHSPLTFDIVADAKALYRKWARMDFNADIVRGVVLKTKALDDKYPTRIDFKFYGTGDMVSGQWWPLRICTLRDGAHGATQAGISGERGKGAYSIVVAGQYDDLDQGDTLEYCGTPDQTKSGNMTDDTQLLRDSFRTKNPVRVLRSGNNVAAKSSGGSNDKKNVYLPASGYRYDGVYDVVEEKLLDAKEQLWTFKLKRQGNQDPIRYSGPYARPSPQDLKEWQKVKQYARHE